jgi:Arc/MetJ family transcription regulator
MRTTLDLDDKLLSAAMSRFPNGTSKTAILEEALRRLVANPLAELPRVARDARIERLVGEGLVQPRSARGQPPPGAGAISMTQLLADLAADREDR